MTTFSEMICTPRFSTPRNPDAETLAPKIAETAKRLGFDLMPWQRYVVDIAYELDTDRALKYSKIVLTVPRQSGKTTLIVPVLTHRCTRWGRPQNVVYTAQTRNAARKKWEDEHVAMLNRSRMRSSFDVRRSNGSEAMVFKNGSKWAIDAPTRTAGHGETVDVGVIDEAFAHADDRVEGAMGPAMITRPSHQIWVPSTAGDASSVYLYRELLAGREMKSGSVAFFEWSAPDDADPTDEEVWRACSPALGHTITIKALRDEFSKLSAKGEEGMRTFRRAYLNQWPEVPILGDAPNRWLVVAQPDWLLCEHADSTVTGKFALGLDRTPDGAFSSLALADGSHGEITAGMDGSDHRVGSDWVVPRVLDLMRRWRKECVGIGIDPKGPAGAFIPDLEKVLKDRLVKLTSQQHAQAAGNLVDAISTHTFRHRGQAELDGAVASVVKRPYGDAFGFARAGLSPISPLVALVCARHVWSAQKATNKPFAV